jgi:hypothetical protein
MTEDNKKEGIEDQGYDTWIASFHSLLSNVSSLVIHQLFKSLFTDFSHVKFDRPLSLFSLSNRLITPLRTGASTALRWICPNHLKRCCTSFSSTGATPSPSRMSSLRIRSLIVLPQIHRSMHISATLLLVGQHSTLYNMIDRIAVL